MEKTKEGNSKETLYTYEISRFLQTWKYNIRRNASSEFSIVTMRTVAIIFFEFGVVKNFMQTF